MKEEKEIETLMMAMILEHAEAMLEEKGDYLINVDDDNS